MSILFDQDENVLEDHLAFELFCTDGSVKEEDGLVWKEVLREDQWAYRPGLGAKPVAVPLKVVSGHSTERGQIGMDDLIESFEDGAVDHVTVPTSHQDKPHENTGFVKRLKKTLGKNGKTRLMAGIEFTEKDIEGKAKRGSIANTSVGVLFDYIKKDTGKKFNQVLGHVALTNKPWINGMQPFGVAASENYTDDEIVPLMLASVVWNNKHSFAWLRDQLSKGLNGDTIEEGGAPGWYVSDVSKNRALVTKFSTEGGADENYVVPFKVQDDTLSIGDREDWVPASKEWVKASEDLMTEFTQNFDSTLPAKVEAPSESAKKDEVPSGASTEEESQTIGEKIMADEVTTAPNGDSPSTAAPEGNTTDLSEEAIAEFRKEFDAEQTKLSEKNEALLAEVHQLKVEKKIESLKADLSEQPGLLKAVREIMLADKGTPVLTLSEEVDGEAKSVELTATDIVNRLLDAVPQKDGSYLLGEQAVSTEDHTKPASDVDSENLSEEEKADLVAESMELPSEYRSKDGDN